MERGTEWYQRKSVMQNALDCRKLHSNTNLSLRSCIYHVRSIVERETYSRFKGELPPLQIYLWWYIPSSSLSILSFSDIPNYHHNEKDVALVLIFIGMLSNQKYFFTLFNTILKKKIL